MKTNKIAMRVFLLIAAFLLLLFFSNDFGLIDIQKTSIITAIGIDKGEEGMLDVTAQIAVPEAGGNGTAGNVSVKGARTVGEAIAELNLKTGWYPTLVHCRLILLGAEATETDVFRSLDYFLRSQFVEDSCLVAVCAERAEDALGAQSPVGDMTYAAIEKVLSSEAQKTGLVSVNNLREFSKGYYSAGKSSFLPVLTLKKDAQGENENGSSSKSDTQGGAAQQSGSAGSDVFDASSTMLFRNGQQAGILDAEETLAFNLADTATDFAYGNVSVFENGENVTYNLKIKITKKSRKISDENGIPVLHFIIRARAQVADASQAGTTQEVAQSSVVPEHVLRVAQERMRIRLDAAFKKAQDCGCDLFRISQSLQRFYPSLLNTLGENALSSAKADFDIRFDTLR